MRQMTVFFILTFALFSCSSKKEDNLIIPTPTNLDIVATPDSITTFPNCYKPIEFLIRSGNIGNAYPSSNSTDYGTFTIYGPQFKDTSRTRLVSSISGKDAVVPSTKVFFKVQIGEQSCEVPITVRVSDFYFANRFLTNCPNDTIFIPRGGNFLLKFTCLDTSNTVVPKAQLQRIVTGFGYSWRWGQNPKFTMSYADRDTVNFYYMFAAFPDITPSIDDYNMRVSFLFSNKSLTLPIWIRY